MLATDFAPAERASTEQLARQAQIVQGFALLKEVLAAVPDLVLVLNEQRQVVFANRATLQLVDGTEEDIRGLRPGELLGCDHAQETPGGCGTTESCRMCGVVGAILAATDGGEVEREGRLTLKSGDALDLRIIAHRVAVGSEAMTVLAMQDIGDEKRRRVLERLFFHDVLNTAGGVKGLADLLEEVSEAERHIMVEMLQDSAAHLVSEIEAQRLLSAAEDHAYVVVRSARSISGVVAEVVGTYTSLARLHSVLLEVEGAVPRQMLETDHTLLGRVLGNLIKNAIEASRAGMTVRIGAERSNGQVHFWVNSQPRLPESVALQLFRRSFSTKGEGRGLGTYAVRLFTERFLHGYVSFTSTLNGGTTFTVALPERTP